MYPNLIVINSVGKLAMLVEPLLSHLSSLYRCIFFGGEQFSHILARLLLFLKNYLFNKYRGASVSLGVVDVVVSNVIPVVHVLSF